MKCSQRPALPCFVVLATGLLAVCPSAYAYLDPSTGSMVVSAIVGIVASVALAVKTYWYKIKGFFRRNKGANHVSRKTPD